MSCARPLIRIYNPNSFKIALAFALAFAPALLVYPTINLRPVK